MHKIWFYKPSFVRFKLQCMICFAFWSSFTFVRLLYMIDFECMVLSKRLIFVYCVYSFRFSLHFCLLVSQFSVFYVNSICLLMIRFHWLLSEQPLDFWRPQNLFDEKKNRKEWAVLWTFIAFTKSWRYAWNIVGWLKRERMIQQFEENGPKPNQTTNFNHQKIDICIVDLSINGRFFSLNRTFLSCSLSLSSSLVPLRRCLNSDSHFPYLFII